MTEPPQQWRDAGFIYCDGVHAEYPSVVRVGDTYYAFYSGYGCYWQIYYATSKDGIHFDKQGPIELQDWAATHAFPYVSYEAGRFKMYYDGGYPYQIGYAESVDGVHWQAQPAPVLGFGPQGSWDEQLLVRPSVVRLDQQSNDLLASFGLPTLPPLYLMYYTGFDQAMKMSIGVAQSVDGLHWQRRAQPVITSTSELYTSLAWVENSTVYLYYREGTNIRLALSKDGLNFAPQPGDPILDKGSGKQWDAGQVYGMFIRRNEAGGYTMYYNGIPELGGNYGMIGIAEGPDLTHFTPRSDNPAITIGDTPANFVAAANPEQTISLSWQRVVTDATTYTLKYGVQSGVYTATVDVSGLGSYSLRPPAPGDYYLTVTASRDGVESYPAEERHVGLVVASPALTSLLHLLADYDLTGLFSRSPFASSLRRLLYAAQLTPAASGASGN